MKHVLAISLILLSTLSFATDNFTIPNAFNSGETISSQKMNENFQALKQKLNETQELLNKLIKLNDLVRETKYLMVGSSGSIFISSDGIDWTSKPSVTQERLNAVTYGNGTFVAVSQSGTILTSTDADSWTSRNIGILNLLYGVTYKQ